METMRTTASILHLDLDAFFAAVEQRDKPSLRGKPVVVGGVGPRGVVATASYEARTFGIRSAMSTAEARSRCPHAAYLTGRFDVYRAASRVVMATLRELTPIVQPLSLDEAFADLTAHDNLDVTNLDDVTNAVERVRADVFERTGLTCSVGVGSSKLMAKIASELNKPNGSFVVVPGTEEDLLGPMPIRAIPGVGPATAAKLRQVGIETIDHARRFEVGELVALLGASAGESLHRLVRGIDHRAVHESAEAKSVSAEDTFPTDLSSHDACEVEIARLAAGVARRLRRSKHSGRTITLKVRHSGFETISRSTTLAAPTDDPRTIAETANRLMANVEIGAGVRLLGVGVSGLADWVQDDLFTPELTEPDDESAPEVSERTVWRPGMDVEHDDHGQGWVWGAGLGVVTVRFESRHTPAGPVHSFRSDDPALRPVRFTDEPRR